MAKLEEVILRGTTVAKPAANTVPEGSLYFDTDLETTEQSISGAWETYTDAGSYGDADAIAAIEGEATLDLSGDVSIAAGKTLQVNGVLGLGETSMTLDHALGTDHHWSGVVISGIAGETLEFGEAVYLKSADSKWWLTDASAEASTKPMVGVCVLAAAYADDPTAILLFGFVRDDSRYDHASGIPLFLDDTTPGAIVSTAPSDSGDQVRVIAYGHDDLDTIFVNPIQVWLEIA